MISQIRRDPVGSDLVGGMEAEAESESSEVPRKEQADRITSSAE